MPLRAIISLLGFLLLAGALGWYLGAAPWLLLAVAAGWLAYQAVEFARFERWSRRPLRRPDNRSLDWVHPTERLFRALRASRARSHGLLERQKRLRVITQAVPDAAVLINRQGEIETLNQAARRLLGLSRQDIGKNLVGLIRLPQLVALIDGKVSENLIEVALPGAAERRLEIRRIAIDRRSMLLLARDVTQLNRLLSMRQDFVANVSHELRTPLTVIMGYLEALEDQQLDAQTTQTLVQRLGSPTRRMKALVDDLLLLTRLESSPLPGQGDLVPVAVPRLLQELVQDARQLSDGRHQIQLDADPSLGLLGMEQELHSAFANLINNAVRYSPAGGEIRVRWLATPAGPRFEVQDQGLGIAPEHLHRLTERFYRVDLAGARIKGGTGLGLAIVKHVLRRHDSQLGIDSKLGRGSLFYVVFPQSRAQPLGSPRTDRQPVTPE